MGGGGAFSNVRCDVLLRSNAADHQRVKSSATSNCVFTVVHLSVNHVDGPTRKASVIAGDVVLVNHSLITRRNQHLRRLADGANDGNARSAQTVVSTTHATPEDPGGRSRRAHQPVDSTRSRASTK